MLSIDARVFNALQFFDLLKDSVYAKNCSIRRWSKINQLQIVAGAAIAA
jgi:hypothetical protein